MEKVTEERLVKAGWDEKRTIDISNIKDVYQKLGLVMPMNVEKFLTVYGMLVFEDDERKENLEFIPEKALGCNLDKVYFEELLEEYDINEIVYPIGVACRGNLMVLMTEQDVFYCYTDGYLEKAGENVEQMLDCLVGECNEAVVIVKDVSAVFLRLFAWCWKYFSRGVYRCGYWCIIYDSDERRRGDFDWKCPKCR